MYHRHRPPILLVAISAAWIASCSGTRPPAATAPHAPGAEPHVTLPIRAKLALAIARPAPPGLLVHVDEATDPTQQLRASDGADLTEIVKHAIASGDYATAWPGGLPRQAELSAHGARAFIVAANVQQVTVDRSGPRASIVCTIGIRIAPWYGVDGGEHWEVSNAATATGTARTKTGLRDELVRLGVRDCVLEVGAAVMKQQILPFLHRLAAR